VGVFVSGFFPRRRLFFMVLQAVREGVRGARGRAVVKGLGHGGEALIVTEEEGDVVPV
jgi:hypothetical protein